jgi:nucleoside-diphosphate-sugar epimerase
MRIAVTGGSGRIGRAVVSHAVAAGHRVVSIDRTPPPADVELPAGVDFVEADLTDYASFERAIGDSTALIHLGAYPSPRGHPDYVVHNNNVVSSYNALSAAARLGIQRVCQASSVNAIGVSYSRWPRYDYFPIDERHPTYNEDAYSLSKWICEQQGDSFARRYEQMVIASLRFHWVVPSRATAVQREQDSDADRGLAQHLWAYTDLDAAARACLLSLTADFTGHEAFFIIAPTTMMSVPSAALKDRYWPDVPLRAELGDHGSFFSSAKAEQMLGWRHDLVTEPAAA